MAKTRQQIEKDVGALVKFVMSEIERVAAMPPDQAGHPYHLEQTRSRLIRKIWDVSKECLAHDSSSV